MQKVIKIIQNAIPIFIMVGLIPLVENDYFLTIIYIVIISISLLIKYIRGDCAILALGFIIMTIFEYIFINTGVETFTRQSFLGVMPLWLPFLWAYGFVAIKRAISIL
ncbi:MAG: hypothetical protein WA060_03495 [Minisyncoccia bacterium]